jgi:sugar phosphate isomerase/epimerase
MFKVGLSGQMFDNLTIWNHLEAAGSVGYMGVELRSTHVNPALAQEQLKNIRFALQDNGLVVSSLSCFVGNFGLQSEQDCERAFEEFKKYVGLSCFYDTEMIRTWPAWQESSSAPQSVWEKAALWMRKSAVYAEQYDKKLVIEMHHGTLCDTAMSSVKLLDMIGMDNVGVTLDPVNLYQVPTDYGHEAIRTLGKYLFNVHIKDIVELPTSDYPYCFSYSYYAKHIGRFTKVVPPQNLKKERYYSHRRINAGGIDWVHVLQSLKTKGYEGWLVVESVSETNRHMPSGKALAKACYQDMKSLLELLS